MAFIVKPVSMSWGKGKKNAFNEWSLFCGSLNGGSSDYLIGLGWLDVNYYSFEINVEVKTLIAWISTQWLINKFNSIS